MVLSDRLPEGITHGQVKTALSAVIERMISAPGTFDSNGWLTIGYCGHQPSAGETYISTGSLYLSTTALLPLGLGPDHKFWTSAPEDWSSRKAWKGDDFKTDHAL